MLRSYSSVSLSYSNLCSFWRRLGNAREQEKASNQLARFVHTLFSVLFDAHTLLLFLKVDTFTTAVCRSSSFEAQERAREREREESVFFLRCMYYSYKREDVKRIPDGDDIGASNVATPTTKELVLEEKRVWSESSSVFVEEQSDEDFWEDAVFACI